MSDSERVITHSFSVKEATEMNMQCAIILYNIRFWIDKNKANNRNFHDGKYWSYCSMSGFQKLFPYMTESTIRGALSRLEKEGHIVTGNYNKTPYDRTKWYSMANQSTLDISQLEIKENSFGDSLNHAPIPDSNKDSNKDSKRIYVEQAQSEDISEVKISPSDTDKFNQYIELCNRELSIDGGITHREFKGSAKVRSQFLARLQDGYKGGDFVNAMKNAMADKYHKETNFRYLTPEFFSREDKLDLWLNVARKKTIDEIRKERNIPIV